MNQPTPPNLFKTVVILAMLWNAMGIINFIMQITLSPEALASYPEAEQELMNSAPIWSLFAFAIGVFGGTLGSVGLWLKKAWSAPILLTSLVAVTLQMGYWVFFTQAVAVYGPSTYGMPTVVVLVALLLVRLSRKGIQKGYLN